MDAQREAATGIVRRLRTEGFSAYLVGGCVRDMLMGRAPKDYDVTTNASPDQVLKFFPDALTVGAQFGVVIVPHEAGNVEVATFRSDGIYADGRHPTEVHYSQTAQEDVQRRDFTINGLLYDPLNDQVLDYVGGQADISSRRLRTIGDPYARLSEDRLRMLRAVRFSARFGFKLEPKLLAAIREVTSLPVTTIVYSHFHVDHIGDGRFWVDQARKAGVDLRIVATRATADKMDFMASGLPKATVVLPNLKDSFKFENLTVESHRFEHPAHTDDHSAWLLKEERILHSPDLLNPDQLPVMGFAVSDTVVYHESNLKEASALDWRHFVGGHGNIGSREDFEFQLAFLDDLRQATLKARTEEPFAKHMIPSANNHAAFAREQREAIIKRVTEALRPKYGKMYGFEASMPMNVELAIRLVGSYY